MKQWIIAAAGFLITAAISAPTLAQSDNPAPPGHGALRQACQADIDKLCSGVEPGGGHVIQCVRQHQDQLSDGCKMALSSARANHQWRRHDASPDAAPSATTAPQS
jgi:hypothetical protein